PTSAEEECAKDPNGPGNCNNIKTYSLTVLSYDVSGTVFHDPNGLTNGKKVDDGTGATASDLYVVAYDPNEDTVTGISVVSTSDGTYTISGLVKNDYDLVLIYEPGTPPSIGDATPTAGLPDGWGNIGEQKGAGNPDDGTVDGGLSLGTV